MKITVQSSKALKPAYGDSGTRPVTTGSVALTVFDKVNFNEYTTVLNFFNSQEGTQPNAALELGLSEALAVRREWAGRFGVDANGSRAILLNDAGARFVEATADVTLSSIMPEKPTPELRSLYPSGDDADELMLVQVTRFACGAMAVGVAAHHLVADGYGLCTFVTAWGEATRGVAIDSIPVHDRAAVFAPRSPPQIMFEHRGVEFKHRCEEMGVAHVDPGHSDNVVVRRVHLSTEMVSELRSRTSAGAPRQYSAFNCVAMHVWRCVTEARGLDRSTVTTLKIAVNGRRRMRDPPVPEGYAGNVVLWARPTTTVGELLAEPLWHIAELFSREVARIDDGYFRSFIDFASSGAVEHEGLVPTADPAKVVHSPDVEVYSLMGIPVYDLDFGAGRPFLHMPGYLPEEGLVYILPSSSGDGSIDVQVCLFSSAMDTFMNRCCSLSVVLDSRL